MKIELNIPVKLSEDDFAKFIFSKGLEIEHYRFDLFYDIRKLMKDLIDNRNVQSEPVLGDYYLMFRSTGTDFVHPDNHLFHTYKARSTEVFKAVFCWNSVFFNSKHSFVEITKIK